MYLGRKQNACNRETRLGRGEGSISQGREKNVQTIRGTSRCIGRSVRVYRPRITRHGVKRRERTTSDRGRLAGEKDRGDD